MPKKNTSITSFEEDLKKLEEIVQNLESGLKLEDAMKTYEEGIKISLRLEMILTEAEKKVYEVKNVKRLSENKDDDFDLDLFE